MVEVRLGRFVHEFAAIHFTAGIENLIEEIFAQAIGFISSSDTMEKEFNKNLNLNVAHMNNNNERILTAALLEQAISFNADLWGLLQPFAHLNAGRMASGKLALFLNIIARDSQLLKRNFYHVLRCFGYSEVEQRC
jgi:ankyrin repeat/BTB/POZ domain-containing protein 2